MNNKSSNAGSHYIINSIVRYIELPVLVFCANVIIQTIFTVVLLHTILARVNVSVGKMDALNMHDDVIQPGRGFLTDGTFM